MNTDQICKALEKQAIEAIKKKYKAASTNYRNGLDMGGSCELITLRDKNSGVGIQITTSDIFQAIESQLVEKRKERVCANAIADFLKSVSSFQGHIQYLEEYLETGF